MRGQRQAAVLVAWAAWCSVASAGPLLPDMGNSAGIGGLRRLSPEAIAGNDSVRTQSRHAGAEAFDASATLTMHALASDLQLLRSLSALRYLSPS